MATHLPSSFAERVVTIFRGPQRPALEGLSAEAIRDRIRLGDDPQACFSALRNINAARHMAAAINTFANGESQ